jgi:predicted AlkP superfamily pyrophosphatase or phosphodiesterase
MSTLARSRRFTRRLAARLLLIAACAPGLAACQGAPAIAFRPAEPPRSVQRRPRLVVQVTVDQLRADLLPRFRGHFGGLGFARFLERGVYFPVASYAHASTETAVGHATLATGALPSAHGIVANEWFDAALGRPRYAVEDEGEQIVGSTTRREGGASPRNLRSTTLGDELAVAFGGRARIVAISSKDRAAVLSAGHVGSALWLDDDSGEVVTSSYYAEALPAWVPAVSERYNPEKLGALRWELALPRDAYLSSVPDVRDVEQPTEGLGSAFPHALGAVADGKRTRALRRTPFADELSLALAEAAIENESLGQDDAPDLLSVSFSATDYIAHAFGPESLELEDQLVRLDRVLERLFAAVLSHVPEEDVLFALSADHGGSESPEYLTSVGLSVRRHDPAALLSELNGALESSYGPGATFVKAFTNPCFWLDEQAIRERGLRLADVTERVRAAVLAMPGFVRAYTRDELAEARVSAGDPFAQRVLASFDAGRTGHVYVVPSAGWLLATETHGLASMHGTPHRYDTDVPVAFTGAGLCPHKATRAIDPRDLAPTLAALLGVKAPSDSSGEVLAEVLRAFGRPCQSDDGR